MTRFLAAMAAGLAISSPAFAQATGGGEVSSAGRTMAALVAEGYEIRAAVPNGAKYVVFLQKETKAFACEFVTVTQSRCGEIK